MSDPAISRLLLFLPVTCRIPPTVGVLIVVQSFRATDQNVLHLDHRLLLAMNLKDRFDDLFHQRLIVW